MHSVRQSASSSEAVGAIAWRSGFGSAMVAASRPILLVAGLAVGLTVLRLSGAGLVPSGQHAGAFVLAAALACAVGAPRQAVAFAAGYGFGFWEGGALAWLASALACAANFFWARAVARQWVRRRLRGRVASADSFIAAHPFSATLGLRLLPVGNNLALNLAAGVSSAAPLPFFAASLLGYLPQTAIFALLGQGVHVARTTQIAVATAMFAASALIGGALFRRVRGSGAPARS